MTSWPARAVLLLASLLLAIALRPMGVLGRVGEGVLPNAIGGAFFALVVVSVERLLRVRNAAGAAGSLGGMLVGGLVGTLLGRLVADATVLSIAESRAFATLALAYIGGAVGSRAARAFAASRTPAPVGEHLAPSGAAIVVDTSSIIDGRVCELATTGVLDGTMLVPAFVLREVQHVADSTDPSRRARGRRGLESLERLKATPGLRLAFPDDEIAEAAEVDDKLVELARRSNARLLTTDFNLNKVATLRGVRVVNVNDLAQALRPTVQPGDNLRLAIVREGKEPGQGLGFLDDGTMVVVDQGRDAVGSDVDVIVTNALQTSAGRMIFARIEPR